MSDLPIVIRDQNLFLNPHRAIFWDEKSTLIVSDLHLGKAGHFRKHGIPISRQVHQQDLLNLEILITDYNPSKIVLLGDLFHSEQNSEWDDFLIFLDRHKNREFILVQGNHDILPTYPAKLEVMQKFIEPPFSFTHYQEQCQFFNISGHIHPGINFRIKPRQRMTLPCFLFSFDHAVIPAFGQFTGLKKIKPEPTDRIFAIADRQVVELTKILGTFQK